MAPKSKKLSPQRGLRALTLFDKLPPGHATFFVGNDGSEPHLRKGEYAVIDTADRDAVHGELYLIQFSERGRRYIKQLKRDYVSITGPDAEPSLVWWISDLRGFKKTGERTHDGVPIFSGLTEGPYTIDDLAAIVIGRVVGYATRNVTSSRVL